MPAPDPTALVTEHTIYACVVGSRAYGLAGPGSDVDRRGVYAAPTPLFWRLDKPPEHVEGPGAEQFSWELERCCVLALGGNPTVLECLWSPIVEAVTPLGAELLAVRQAFLSTRLAETYAGYATSQLRRWEHQVRRDGEVRWKQAMHMLRLLIAGAHVLRTGEVLVDVTHRRDELLAVRRGERSLDEVHTWADRLSEEMARAATTTVLPVEPDRASIDDLLVRARRALL